MTTPSLPCSLPSVSPRCPLAPLRSALAASRRQRSRWQRYQSHSASPCCSSHGRPLAQPRTSHLDLDDFGFASSAPEPIVTTPGANALTETEDDLEIHRWG